MSLLSRFDRPDNVRKLGEKLAATGTTLEKKDVQALLGAAKDLGSVTAAEKAELKKIFESHGNRFAPDAKEELAKFLGIAVTVSNNQALDGAVAARENRRAARGAGAASAEKLAAVSAKLPEVGGERFALNPDGYMNSAAKPDAGPPKADAAGAERVYQSGRALAEAPAGVLKGVGVATQEKLLNNTTKAYDQALAQTMSSKLSTTEANRLRSGAFATMAAVIEGADSATLKKKAAEQYLERAMKEPNEGMRDTAWRNIEAMRGSLPAELGAKIDALKGRVLPEKPPYDEWFANGNKTLNVRHYAHDECWAEGGDPIRDYKKLGLKVVKHETTGEEEKWVLEGKLKDPTGKNPETPVRLELYKTHDEFMRDMGDKNVHAIFYTGHSNLGGNVSEAVQRGPEENGKKLVHLGVCRGQQNLFEVANKYPHAHLTTTRDPHYFVNMMDGIEGQLKGIARRDTWDGISRGTQFSHTYLEGEENLIRPNQARRYEYLDIDHDGRVEASSAGRDKFFDVVEPGSQVEKNDLKPRPSTKPIDQLDGSAVMDGANFARTLLTYHADHGDNTGSKMKRIEGDRIVADGWFDAKGSSDLVHIREEKGSDGKPVYKVSVNKDLESQSKYAIGALIQYEMFRQASEKANGGTFSAQDKARALVATGEYLSYMYCSMEEANSILKAVGQRAGVKGLTYHAVETAIKAGEGYAGNEQTAALAQQLGIR